MSVHKLKNGKWCFRKRVTLLDGSIKNVQRNFATKKEAQLQEQLFKIDDNDKHDFTFEEVFTHYLDYRKSRVKYASTYAVNNVVKLHLLPYFGSMPIKKINSLKIIEWQNEFNKNDYSPNYKAKIFVYFKTILQHAVKHFNMEYNPADRVDSYKRDRNERKSIDFLTYDEFQQFINVVDEFVYELYFSTLYYTGLRKGEAQALFWKDLLWETKEFNIYKTMSASHGTGKAFITTPKTPSANRRVPIAETLFNKLRAYYESQKLIDGFDDNCFIFGTTKYLSSSSIDRARDKYCKLAVVKKIRIHDFRHSFASLMINLGVDLFHLSKMLGHASIEETSTTYGHLYPNAQAKIISDLDNFEHTKVG